MSKRVKILRETMRAAEEGRYFAGEKEVKLPYSFEKIKEVTYYSPEQAAQLSRAAADEGDTAPARVTLRDLDTLEAAYELHQRREETEKPVLVLNFANPHRPGGGIRAKPGTPICWYLTSWQTPWGSALPMRKRIFGFMSTKKRFGDALQR